MLINFIANIMDFSGIQLIILVSFCALTTAFPAALNDTINTSIASPSTVSEQAEESKHFSVSTESLPPTTKGPPLRVRANCPSILRPECVCQDTNARVYVMCVGLQLSDLLDLRLGDTDSVVWLRISDSRFPSLGPRSISTLRVEGLQINSSNLSHVNEHAFIDTGHLRSLALQDNLLADVPVDTLQRLPNLEMVSLAGNQIEKVPKNAFSQLHRLYYVSLSQNHIKIMESGCFGENVRQLALSDNRISSLNDSVRTLSKLEWLLLTGNEILSLKNQLVHLQSLIHLHVGHNNITDLHQSFTNLHRLKTLNLSRNSVSSIGESDFEGLTFLSTLDLSYNIISDISPLAFHHFKHLTSLDLSGNRLTSVDSFLEPLSRTLTRLYLRDNFLSTYNSILPALRSLDLSKNRLTSLFSSGLNPSNRHFTRLEQLILSDNHLQQLPDNFRHLTPVLVDLQVDRNRLADLEQPFGGEHGHWKRLLSLNLSGNALESVTLRSFHHVVTLTELDLSHNRLVRLEAGCFEHLKEVQGVDLSHNRLEYLDLGLLDPLVSLQHLNVAHNLVAGVHPRALERLSNLNHLDLSWNRLQSLRYFLKPLRQLHTLNASYNQLTEVDGTDLAEVEQLKELRLSHNKITSVGNTQQLNLAHLSLLALDHNQLVTVDSLTLHQLPHLQQLDLTNNFLSHLPPDLLVANRRLRSLSIQENPWVCDNNFIDILLVLEADGVYVDEKNRCINSIIPVDGANLI